MPLMETYELEYGRLGHVVTKVSEDCYLVDGVMMNGDQLKNNCIIEYLANA